MKLTALRQAIMDKINAQLPELKAVAPTRGGLTWMN